MEYTGGGGAGGWRREGLVSCLMVFERDITLTGGGRGELGRDGGGGGGVGRRNFGRRKGGPCFILRTITTWCTFALLYI